MEIRLKMCRVESSIIVHSGVDRPDRSDADTGRGNLEQNWNLVQAAWEMLELLELC